MPYNECDDDYKQKHHEAAHGEQQQKPTTQWLPPQPQQPPPQQPVQAPHQTVQISDGEKQKNWYDLTDERKKELEVRRGALRCMRCC